MGVITDAWLVEIYVEDGGRNEDLIARYYWRGTERGARGSAIQIMATHGYDVLDCELVIQRYEGGE